ncbi:MAG: hypothetical protein WCI43_07485 [Candidatus Firestonebacteria bacterium]
MFFVCCLIQKNQIFRYSFLHLTPFCSPLSAVRKRSEDTKKASSPEGCPYIDDIKMQKNIMKKILKEIKSGKFAREWIKENETGRKNFDSLIKAGDDHLIEKVGKQLREMMPWMKK